LTTTALSDHAIDPQTLPALGSTDAAPQPNDNGQRQIFNVLDIFESLPSRQTRTSAEPGQRQKRDSVRYLYAEFALPSFSAERTIVARMTRASMRPGLAPLEREIVRIGNLALDIGLRLEQFVGNAMALAICDRLFLGREAEPDLLAHIG
jgi:hypothetical protein